MMNKQTIQKKAEEAAKKICTRGCYAGYESCKKPQRTIAETGRKIEPLPLFGEDNGCPLAKYDVPDAPSKSFFEQLDSAPTLNDCFWLCAACKDGVLHEDKDGYFIDMPKWETVCLDCPVQKTRESISEAEAEARMS